jgi:anti-sigma B factor antagonist
MDQALTIRVRHHRAHVLITVAGEIDIVTVPQLRARLIPLAAASRPLIVDLDQVSFLDAAALGVLARAAGKAAASGGSLHVVSTSRIVRRVFAISGMDRHIPLARTRAEALASLPVRRQTRPGAAHPAPAPAWPASIATISDTISDPPAAD